MCLRLLQPAFLLQNDFFCSTKRPGSLATICYCLVLCFFCLTGTPEAASPSRTEFTGSGEIIVISYDFKTLAVEVIYENRPRIVGGKLASDAILFRGESKSDLKSFHVGEKVHLSWRETAQGKEIITISSQHSPAPPESVHRANPPPIDQPKPAPQIAVVEDARAVHSQAAPVQPLIGQPMQHVIGKKETLLDIARHYNLGYNEIIDMYPEYDPWLPPVGKKLLLPTERLLPDSTGKGIVINIPELRLYHFTRKGKTDLVTTYPIGIGDTDFQTLSGIYTIGNKALNPTWYIPPSLRQKYKVSSIPPGPDNPLGQYWLGLKGTMFGIHGTDIPWSVGRTVTHGCIRMYPEDIQLFFPAIQIGTQVQVLYEPVKIARSGDNIFIEVHQDIYSKIESLEDYAREKAVSKGIWEQIDQQRFMAAIQGKKGIPVNVSSGYRVETNTGSAPSDAAVYVTGPAAVHNTELSRQRQ